MRKALFSAISKVPVLMLLAFGSSPSHAAQVAASIEYDVVTRPSGLPDDFQPGPGTSLKFLAIKAIDGFRVDAALWQPSDKQPAHTALLVMVHGSGCNYTLAPNSTLSRSLSQKGYAALAINTRQHDDQIYTENFLDIPRDIDAAVQTARALGYRSIVLQGHSLGTIQVQFYAATNWDPDIKGVILLGAFGNLPWKSRNLLVQNEENFQALIDASMKALRNGTLAEYLPVKMRAIAGPGMPITGQAVPITGQHFLTYRWEQTSVADGTYWIHRIPLPILLVRDQADGLVQPFEPYQLLSAAHAEGSLVTNVRYVLLPNAKPPDRDGHLFIGNEQPLTETVLSWLAEQHL
jgi:pimeloyl-ACP methyl ester carboxylesterase